LSLPVSLVAETLTDGNRYDTISPRTWYWRYYS
jgi:hypothetical protein